MLAPADILGDMPLVGIRGQTGLMNERITLDDILIPGTDREVRARYLTLASRAETERFGLYEDDVVILDTETTGFDPERDEIIEIAAARMNGPDIVDRFSTYVNPLRHIPPDITELTGIDDETVRDAPTLTTALSQLVAFVGDCDIVAHNADFDRRFVMRDLAPGSLPGLWIDSLELARVVLPRLKMHNLETLSQAFLAPSSTHDAADDVEALCVVWRVLLTAACDLPEGLLGYLCTMRPETNWPLRKVFSWLAGSQASSRFSLGACRDVLVRQEKVPNKVDAEGHALVFPTAREIQGLFAPGSLVGRMYRGYEERPAQVQMACEVSEAFATCTHRAIEAGTGVGKSIAYLLPAAIAAQRNGIGIGVATKTNALMDQLVYHELPLLAKVLPDPLHYVALKGYEHYPCLRKLERFAAEEAEGDGFSARRELSMLAVLYAFVSQTAYGDLDAVNLYWKELPKGRICAAPGECTHGHCRFYPNRCLLHGLRLRARGADIVVTNHALLFRDVVLEGSILPPIRHWIVDEAHSVESEARRQLSSRFEEDEVLGLLKELERDATSLVGEVRRVAAAVDGALPILAAVARIEDEAQRAENLAVSFFSFVKDLEPLSERSSYDHVDLWVNEQVRESGPWAVVEHTGRSLISRLGTLIDQCKDLLGLLDDASEGFDVIRAELFGLSGRLFEMRETLLLCMDGESPDHVFSAELDRRPDHHGESISASLLDVGEMLHEEFYPRMMSVVYTSATIATGESFAHFAHATGLDRLPDGAWRSLQLGSGYDYENNMTVFVAADMAEPRTPVYADQLRQLLYDVHRAMGGSVLTLFTNRREMEAMYEMLRGVLEEEGITLLCQRRGISARRLRDEFCNQVDTSLFALRSFWEGFDAPGDTLRCVIVPRLPFSRPNDPLSLERDLREDNAWARYALPEAVLDLKQAAGRLIRTSTDSGFLVLADSRLVTKRYGKAFLQALPSQNQHRIPRGEIGPSIARRL